jgi:non-ribosomal peptide synthetase component F
VAAEHSPAPTGADTLPRLVDEAARRWPELTAVEYGDDHVTFARFAARTHRIAAGLHALGAGPATAWRS